MDTCEVIKIINQQQISISIGQAINLVYNKKRSSHIDLTNQEHYDEFEKEVMVLFDAMNKVRAKIISRINQGGIQR